MASPNTVTLYALCERYGPGRLPNADNHAIGAGYAAATAAVFVAAVYASAVPFFDSLGPAATDLYNVLLAGAALVLFVPAAFLAGYVGWLVLSPNAPVTGAVAGLVGVVITYGVALLLFGLPMTAFELVAGTDPLRTAVFSWGVVYFAFVETWWATLPVGCLSGFTYVTVVRQH